MFVPRVAASAPADGAGSQGVILAKKGQAVPLQEENSLQGALAWLRLSDYF